MPTVLAIMCSTVEDLKYFNSWLAYQLQWKSCFGGKKNALTFLHKEPCLAGWPGASSKVSGALFEVNSALKNLYFCLCKSFQCLENSFSFDYLRLSVCLTISPSIHPSVIHLSSIHPSKIYSGEKAGLAHLDAQWLKCLSFHQSIPINPFILSYDSYISCHNR